jgi:hypothetical protein
LLNNVADEESKEAGDLIVDFCIDGLAKFEDYRGIENTRMNFSIIRGDDELARFYMAYYVRNKLEKLKDQEHFQSAFRQLCHLIVIGEIDHKYMNLQGYEIILALESSYHHPRKDVVDFCIEGLQFFKEYRHCNEILIIGMVIKKYTGGSNIKTFKRAAAAAVATVAAFCIIVAIAFPDYARELFKISDEEPSSDISNITRSNEVRYYETIDELLELENIKILYPVGYKFTDVVVHDFGTHLEMWAYSIKHGIKFSVEIGVNYPIDDYEYETNGIKYNIVEVSDGLYQAYWIDGSNYYRIDVSDKAVLSEIIKNLKEG